MRSSDSDSPEVFPSGHSDEAEFEKLDRNREKVSTHDVRINFQFVATTASEANKELQKEVHEVEAKAAKLEVEMAQGENKLNNLKAEFKVQF